MTDPFSTLDLANNWNKIDKSPGPFICTSATRPAWGSQNAGRQIAETDTGLTWKWNGTAFVRAAAQGLLKTTSGAYSVGSRSTDFGTTSGYFTEVVAANSVVIPDGLRPIRVTLNMQQCDCDNGRMGVGALADGQELARWATPGRTNPVIFIDNVGGGHTFQIIWAAGYPAGVHNFSFSAFSNNGFAAYVRGPSSITVEEM